MKIVILGTGLIGSTIVHELSKSNQFDEIIAVDGFQKSLDKCMQGIKNSSVTAKLASLGDHNTLVGVLKGADIAIACLPHSLSLSAVKAAIEAKCNLVNLVGSKYLEIKELEEEAKEAGVIIVPGCGVAPGIVSFLAARGVELLDEAEEAVMICGGVPKHPLPPLWYQVVFRLESVMGLYTRKSLASENGKVVEIPSFSGLETLKFPDPVGECEAITSDAHSVAFTLKDKVKRIYEKTVRHKGHFEKMRVLNELGFLEDTQIEVEGKQVNSKQFTMALLEPQLKGESNEDITVLRVSVKGRKKDKEVKLEWEMVDVYDKENNITSMAKTTAYPAVIMAEWIAEGRITNKGVIAPEELVIGALFDPFITELESKGITISFKEEIIKSLNSL
ncbi:saccharopine dehydrogenase family protein [Oceanobacillus sp. CF4.6]|uniref:saccharopine dehydrogenase family protein n=1 Tax=Oceanobacillus sp. CF4.6 TaxID=3373080 RepID=UPI003EE51BD5